MSGRKELKAVAASQTLPKGSKKALATKMATFDD